MHFYILIFVCFFSFPIEAFQFDCENPNTIDTNKITSYISQIESQDDSLSIDGKLVSKKLKAYEKLFKNCIDNRQSFRELSIQELYKHYKNIHTIAFYTSNVTHVNYMQTVLDETIKRGEKNKSQLSEMYRAYVQTRQFTQANRLKKQYPDIGLSRLPTIKGNEGGGRSLLFIEQDGKILVQKSFDFSQGAQIVVISSPICGPSRRYLSWLQTKREILSVFNNHSTWIMPVTGQLYIDEVVESNKKNAPIKMAYTYKESDWPEITYWGTPTFYFYLDGKLKQQIVGWPREGREKELKQALKDIGLLS
ncbi:hypothetical protein H0A36_24385 [Endozoicomonas sp. SM1973]|uniref:Thioredoxin domain-containing protein n=1 Tax=Spartinivicinus marinus TaxID=2994442 RepID=A0A853I771_9GAMM|nr:hypothetical protein [Spartinivicinus marinus]MCX4026412.1 hypothetical protein [Spartinivicinus marinus]NYZ69163.1 hypothetical protein [Spartinivicinus marinus]